MRLRSDRQRPVGRGWVRQVRQPRWATNGRRAPHESRYGTCAFASASAEITLPSAERLLLICCASKSVSPEAPVLKTFSHPARSTAFSRPATRRASRGRYGRRGARRARQRARPRRTGVRRAIRERRAHDEREDGVRARRVLVHQRRCDRTRGVAEPEEAEDVRLAADIPAARRTEEGGCGGRRRAGADAGARDVPPRWAPMSRHARALGSAGRAAARSMGGGSVRRQQSSCARGCCIALHRVRQRGARLAYTVVASRTKTPRCALSEILRLPLLGLSKSRTRSLYTSKYETEIMNDAPRLSERIVSNTCAVTRGSTPAAAGSGSSPAAHGPCLRRAMA